MGCKPLVMMAAVCTSIHHSGGYHPTRVFLQTYLKTGDRPDPKAKVKYTYQHNGHVVQ